MLITSIVLGKAGLVKCFVCLVDIEISAKGNFSEIPLAGYSVQYCPYVK